MPVAAVVPFVVYVPEPFVLAVANCQFQVRARAGADAANTASPVAAAKATDTAFWVVLLDLKKCKTDITVNQS